jgi:menaquinone-dependent protoporphyrinogen oxidase
METDPISRTSCDVPVFFASTEGHTRSIAEHLVAALRHQGLDSRAFDLAGGAVSVDWTRARAVLVGGSLHVGAFQPEVRGFVRQHVAELNARPSAFFAVSLSAASTSADMRAEAERLTRACPAACGWTPLVVASLAGKLAYTQYGFLKRIVLQRIARKEGGPTDTSRDHELTDWNEVDALAGRIVEALRGGGRSTPTEDIGRTAHVG